MKLLLSTLLVVALVALPAPADAKTSRSAASSCTGTKTVEIRHGRKTVKAFVACPQKTRVKPRFVPIFVWS
jgi:hypothetical protein